MYEASDLFKKAISQQNRILAIRATIDNKVYQDTAIQECSIEESILTGEDFKFGSSTASRLELTLLNMDESLTAKSFERKEVFVEIGVQLDKFSQPFEFTSMGFFVVEEPTRDKSLVKLTGYDKMIYFEKPYVSSLAYPATLKQILQEVCSLSGVELQTTSFLNDDFVIDECPDLSNVTLRNVLEYISELSCSFASINRSGKLELVTLKETDTSINADNYYEMNLSEYEFGPIDQVTISQENIFAAYITQQQKDNMLAAVRGFTFRPFTTTWQGNPLTAPSDIITVTYRNGTPHKSFIANQKFTFSAGLKCEVKTNAKTAIRTETETPGPISKVIESTKKEMRSKFEQVEDRITLEVEAVNESIATLELQADSISLRVEEINTSVAAISLKADSISLSVSSLDSRLGNAESSISIQAGQISSKVEAGGVISAINQSPEMISIHANKIQLVGAVSVLSDITGQLGTVIGGTMVGTKWKSSDEQTPFDVYVGGDSHRSMRVYNGSLRLEENGVEFCAISKYSGITLNGQPIGTGTAKFG